MLKIIDLGMCKIELDATHYEHVTYADVQTLWYRAPEMMMKMYASHTSRIDVWSVGYIIYQIYTGRPLLCGETVQDQLKIIFTMCGSPTSSDSIDETGTTGIPYTDDMVGPVRQVLSKSDTGRRYPNFIFLAGT